jgi:2-methylcitrate dehydratase PrpD
VRVEICFKQGDVQEETVEAPRGSEHKFATEEDVIAKFRKLSETQFSREKTDKIIDLVMNAEKLSSAQDIAKALQA